MQFTPARRTALYVRMHHHIGLAGRRRAPPRPQPPRLIESDYAAAIVSTVLEPVHAALAPLVDALPDLLRAAARARGARHDEDDTGRARALLERGRAAARVATTQGRLDTLADRTARQVAQHQRGELRRQTTAVLGVDVPVQDATLGTLNKHFIAENVSLLRSLVNKLVDDVDKLTHRAFTSNQSAAEVAAEIAKRNAQAERHARLIARDQVAKQNAQVTRARHAELGIRQFRWLTMNDSHVRPTHDAMGNKVWSYDGVGAPQPSFLPGDEILCRCLEQPVFEDILQMLDNLIAA